jgi:hypothetical protein
VKDGNGDLLTDRWKNNFSQLLTVHNVSDVRQIEIRTAEPLVPGPSYLEVEIAIAELRKYKPLGNDQIPAELYQAGGETLVSAIHKLINSNWKKEEFLEQWNESIIIKNAIFWDVTPCGACKNRRFGGT